ncbi:MAG: hypothetical protein OXI55_12725 [Gammaproteobacteria bacterium]|nr:hypothetical protein [Gammaproteobacteria bacterium]
MPTTRLPGASLVHAAMVCAALALVTDVTGAHLHFDEECAPCIMVEADGTSELSATSDRPVFANSRPVEACANSALTLSQASHQPRAPPILP